MLSFREGKVGVYDEHTAKGGARRDGVRWIGADGGPRMGSGVHELLKLASLNISKKQEMFLVKAWNDAEHENKLVAGTALRESKTVLLERDVGCLHVAEHGTECGFQDSARTAVRIMLYILEVPVILEVTNETCFLK